jgi:hypothetical protein
VERGSLSAMGREAMKVQLCGGCLAALLIVSGCSSGATPRSIQPFSDRPVISGLSMEAAQRWLEEHTLGCEQITTSWVRPQQWDCVNDGTPFGEAVETVRLIGDEHGVYEIDGTLSPGVTTTNGADTAASAFWMLMELPFGQAGKPDYTRIKAEVAGGRETVLAGVVFNFGRSGQTYTFRMTAR